MEEEEEYYDDESISDISDLHLEPAIQYTETEERKAMREAMEEMVSNVMPEENDNNVEDDIIVLSPDHPLLQGFHKSVAKHLEKQKLQILNDIRELSATVKARRREVDDTAEGLYGLQQTVRRQQNQIDLKTDNLSNDTEVRQELDTKIQELKVQHEKEAETVTKAQTYEEQLWRKLNELTDKENEARKKKEEEDSKLAVVRRATEKAQVDKKLLAEEKKKQDELVFRLTCEVAELQSRSSQIESQLEAKSKEKARIAQATTTAADDLVTQNGEYIKLVQAWQRLLISAQNKDKEHAKLLQNKEMMEEEKRTLDIQLEGCKRGGLQEMERNEKLTLCVRHLEKNQQIVEQKLAKERDNVEEAERKLDGVDAKLNETEEKLNRTKQEHVNRIEKKKVIEKEISTLTKQQLNLEQRILEALNDQASQDKAVQYAIRNVEKIHKEIDALEIQLAQREVAVGELKLNVEKQRFQAACTSQLSNQSEETVSNAQQDVASLELQLHRIQGELITGQTNLDRLNKKLNSMLAKTGGKEISAVKIKINELDENIKEMTTEIEGLQKKLLRKEIGLLEQTKNRTNLKKEIEDCQNHVTHLQHKSLAQKETLEKAELQNVILHKKTEEELHTLSNIDKEHSKLKDLKQSLEQQNIFAHKDIIAARKEEEQALERLNKCMDELANEKEKLHQELSEYQKKQVDIEAKVTLATETKKAIDKERGSSGEIAELTSEIHRMEVRLSQLKKTQDRLTLDLQQCVSQRDAMVDTARARSTRSTGGPTSAYIKIMRKLENIRHSNKQLLTKVQQLRIDKSNLIKLEEEIKPLEESLSNTQKEIMKIKEPFLASDSRLSSLQIKKKQNLEQLVHEQKRCKGLSDAKEGKYKPLHRSEASLSSEAQRQRVTRTNLLSVIESLRPDFPLLNSKLSAIAAPLKSIRVTYNTEVVLQEEVTLSET